MNITGVFYRFPDQEACIAHLEKVRWGDDPHCPHCGSTSVARKDDQGRVGRWNCHGCKSSFNVLSGTIFEKTRIPLQKWFLGIALIVNARKSLSSCQLARDLDMTHRVHDATCGEGRKGFELKILNKKDLRYARFPPRPSDEHAKPAFRSGQDTIGDPRNHAGRSRKWPNR